MKRPLLLLAFLLALPSATPAQEHAHPAGSPEQLGSVSFTVSCRPEVHDQFARGVAMLHSFWFGEAERVFAEVAAADPSCAMAHWGIALAKRGNPYAGAPAAANLPLGLAAADRAATLMASASPREQGYIRAALTFYREHDTRDHRSRMADYERLMRELHEQNQADVETAIFYAQSIIANAPPTDLTFARQQAAAAILEPLFARYPEHPGLAHYLIHAYDAPPLAGRGLAAASRYSAIAPSAPHALHMPSHIFTRLGKWDESIESNLRAAEAEGTSPGRVHPMDYLVYAYLQQGRDAAAARVAEGVRGLSATAGYSPIIRYNHFAIPARLLLERGRWAEAAALPMPQEEVGPEFLAIPHFTRGIGAARGGQVAAAKVESQALARLEEALTQRGDTYWPVLVRAQRLAIDAWIAHGEGRHAESMRLAAEAAEVEETVEKHPVTPGPLLPARELLGDILLLHGRAAEAQQAYEANLRREPNRARSLHGAALAAERAGDRAAARAHYAALLELMSRADTPRPEAAAARAFLGS